MHSVNALGLLDLLNHIIDLIELQEVVLDVLEHVGHFFLKCLDEVFLLIVRAVAVHLVAYLVNLLELTLGGDESFSEYLGFLFKDLGGIIHVLKNKLGVEVFDELFEFIKTLLHILKSITELSNLGDD